MTRTALITGASRGLGAALAEVLAPAYHIIAVARTTGGLEELDDRIQAKGGAATLVPLDLLDDVALKRLCASIHERWGGVALWAHMAIHAAPLAPVAHIDNRDFDKSVALNVTATQRLIQNIEPLLQAQDGRAIYFNDDQMGHKFFGAYGATKAAQSALFHAWAAETQNANITISGFAPAPMPTATRARFYPGEDRDALTPCAQEAQRLIADLSLI